MTAFDDLLRYDPLTHAETLTGEDYKTDERTSALGLALHLQHSRLKKLELEARDDTHYGTPFWNTLRIYTALGFEPVHAHLFPSSRQYHASDRFVVLWRPDGVLATLESYGDSTNSTKIYYNWRPNEDVEGWSFMSSGHWLDGVLVGDHDARQGLRHTLSRLEGNGTFLDTWVERPFLWFLDYSQTRVEDYDYQLINEECIQRLPEHVREAITP